MHKEVQEILKNFNIVMKHSDFNALVEDALQCVVPLFQGYPFMAEAKLRKETLDTIATWQNEKYTDWRTSSSPWNEFHHRAIVCSSEQMKYLQRKNKILTEVFSNEHITKDFKKFSNERNIGSGKLLHQTRYRDPRFDLTSTYTKRSPKRIINGYDGVILAVEGYIVKHLHELLKDSMPLTAKSSEYAEKEEKFRKTMKKYFDENLDPFEIFSKINKIFDVHICVMVSDNDYERDINQLDIFDAYTSYTYSDSALMRMYEKIVGIDEKTKEKNTTQDIVQMITYENLHRVVEDCALQEKSRTYHVDTKNSSYLVTCFVRGTVSPDEVFLSSSFHDGTPVMAQILVKDFNKPITDTIHEFTDTFANSMDISFPDTSTKTSAPLVVNDPYLFLTSSNSHYRDQKFAHHGIVEIFRDFYFTLCMNSREDGAEISDSTFLTQLYKDNEFESTFLAIVNALSVVMPQYRLNGNDKRLNQLEPRLQKEIVQRFKREMNGFFNFNLKKMLKDTTKNNTLNALSTNNNFNDFNSGELSKDFVADVESCVNQTLDSGQSENIFEFFAFQFLPKTAMASRITTRRTTYYQRMYWDFLTVTDVLALLYDMSKVVDILPEKIIDGREKYLKAKVRELHKNQKNNMKNLNALML